MSPLFILLVLKLVNVAVIATILMIHMQKCDVIKNINVKVFNLMSRSNESRHVKWHETCKCKYRLDANVL